MSTHSNFTSQNVNEKRHKGSRGLHTMSEIGDRLRKNVRSEKDLNLEPPELVHTPSYSSECSTDVFACSLYVSSRFYLSKALIHSSRLHSRPFTCERNDIRVPEGAHAFLRFRCTEYSTGLLIPGDYSSLSINNVPRSKMLRKRSSKCKYSRHAVNRRLPVLWFGTFCLI